MWSSFLVLERGKQARAGITPAGRAGVAVRLLSPCAGIPQGPPRSMGVIATSIWSLPDRVSLEDGVSALSPLPSGATDSWKAEQRRKWQAQGPAMQLELPSADLEQVQTLRHRLGGCHLTQDPQRRKSPSRNQTCGKSSLGPCSTRGTRSGRCSASPSPFLWQTACARSSREMLVVLDECCPGRGQDHQGSPRPLGQASFRRSRVPAVLAPHLPAPSQHWCPGSGVQG